MADTIGRRELLGGVLLAAPLAHGAANKTAAPRPLKVVAVGAHPDDPESGCGGTLLQYRAHGHEVVCLYLTRGEAGIEGRSAAEAAATRTAEAEQACHLLGARALFAEQVDGATEVSPERYQSFGKLLLAERPDVVFAHWPIDSQRDHRAASLLVYDAWLAAHRSFSLYYFEVLTGMQTQAFHPTDYVEITAQEAQKKAACFAHHSQDPESFWSLHASMHAFRGAEHGVPRAEAFVRHDKGPLALAGLGR